MNIICALTHTAGMKTLKIMVLSAAAAALAWLAARSQGGRMVLRLEDLDPDRCTQAWCDQVMRDLEWLGLDWDNEPVYQSRRTEA